MAMLSDLFQINDLRTPKLLEVAHWCLWMKIELAQKSRRPYCKLCMPEPRVHQAGLGINADAWVSRPAACQSLFPVRKGRRKCQLRLGINYEALARSAVNSGQRDRSPAKRRKRLEFPAAHSQQ